MRLNKREREREREREISNPLPTQQTNPIQTENPHNKSTNLG